jgi:BirA family transcriptional regulator, biotin operon repressor / biotin---[acetyl-CoA-carboxylase] ligase
LSAQAGQPVNRVRLLRAILQRLEARYSAVTTPDPLALHTDWTARLVWLGEPVVAHTPGGDTVGRAESVDLDGALVLRLDNGERVRVLAGDVRLRQMVD